MQGSKIPGQANNSSENIPLNTKRVYLKVTDPGGCIIYVPCNSNDKEYQLVERQQIQDWLNKQFPNPPDIIA